MFLTWCLLLCLITGTVPEIEIDIDVPDSVLVGQQAVLRCYFELTEGEKRNGSFMKWWRRHPTANNDFKFIYQRFFNQSPDLQASNVTWLIGDNENDTIILNAAEPRDTGVYECEVDAGTQEKRRGHLLVVYTPGSGPRLNVTRMENGTLLAECSVDDASPQPELVISADGVTLATTTDGSSLREQPDGTWDAHVATVVEASDSILFVCDLNFVSYNFSHPTYSNDYEYSRTGRVNVTRELTSELPMATTQNDTEIQVPQGDGCVKLGASILMPATLVLMQLMCSLKQLL